MPDLKNEALFDVNGLVVVITGGTGVLGGAMAAGLAANGAQVVLLGRSPDKGAVNVQACQAAGGKAEFMQADVTDRASLEATAESILSRYGKIDVLVNAAGGNNPKATATDELKFFDMPYDALMNVMELNILGTILPSQIFGKVMAEAGQGSIVNISSMSAMKPLTKVIGYSAAKAAVDNFTQWLSTHMNQNYAKGIRVNAIAPGFFLTDQNRYLLTDKETGALTPRGQTIIAHTPMDRFGEPDELVSTLVWLISPGAKFITGITVPVDGGFSAFGGI